MNKNLFARLGALAVLSAGSVSAFAVDPATASEALTQLQGSSTGLGPIMFGIAVVSVGILIGVKWIKRGRGAA